MVITLKKANHRGLAHAAAVLAGSVMAAAILTPFIILTGCSGGSGTAAKGGPSLEATIGEVCIESESSYSVDVKDEEPLLIEAEPNPLAARYAGSVGGQIRAVNRFSSAKPEEPLVKGMVWGLGAALRYGTPDYILGSVALSRPGTVTGLVPIRVAGEPKVVAATEGGIALMGYDSDGNLAEETESFRPVLARTGRYFGVLSVDATQDGGIVAFTTADGYLQSISADELKSGEKCSEVVASASSLGALGETFMPVKVRLGADRAFVLAKPLSAMTPIAPTYTEAYGPLFYGMHSGRTVAVVRSVGFKDNKVAEVKFEASDGSFGDFDGFIPTDVHHDGGVLFVAGLAFRKAGVSSFISEHCSSAETDDEKTKCLLEAAATDEAALTLYKFDGRNAISGGFFIFRNLDDLSKADHYEMIPISVFPHHTKAPPFTFRIAVDGSQGYVRAPNFLLPITRTDDGEGKEDWTLGKEIDLGSGLAPGIPNDILLFSSGAASTFTAVKNADGSGASALEYGDSTGIFHVDDGAVYVRVEGGGTGPEGPLVAAIEMENEKGGKLYLESPSKRLPIEVGSYPNAYVARADYDGTNVAFVWSSTGPDGKTEASEPWRLVVQKGISGTPSDKSILRTETVEGIFKGFPSDPKGNSVGDVFLSKGSLAVFLTGYSGGKRYFQPAVFDTSLSFKAAAEAIGPVSGTHAGKILKIENQIVTFSAPDGVYTWSVLSGATKPVKKISRAGLIDAAMDATGKTRRVALVSGFKVEVRDMTNPSNLVASLPIPKSGSYAGTSAGGAKVAIAGDLVFLSTPYGTSSASLLVYDLKKDSTQTPLACSTCDSMDVNLFEADPRYLMVSGVGSGIEIYDVSTK